MKILFVNPVTPPELFRVQLLQGLGYLSAALKKEGHETKLICPHVFDKKQITDTITYFKPDLIAASSVTDQFELCKAIFEFIHEKFKIPVVLGGVHATVAPEEAIAIKGIMGIGIGECDEAMLELANAIEKKKEYKHIRNFWFKDKGKIIKNPVRPLIKDLNALPFPDREIFEGIVDTKDEMEFMGSRGCPFQCSYCINRVLMNMYKNEGQFVRYRTVYNLLDEMEQALKKYKTNKVLLHDDTFTLKRKWLAEFCEKYPKRIGVPFVANGRVETIDEGIVRMLKKAGCDELKIGVEAGNDFIRNKILNRGMTKKQIINAFRLCHKYGIKTASFNMIGIPFETEETIKETIQLNKKVKPYIIAVSIFQPYNGTELYNICKKKGWLSERKVKSYFEEATRLDLPTISTKKIKYYYKLFKFEVYYPRFAFFVKILLKTGMYDPAMKILWAIRMMLVKVLTAEQKEFLMKYVKF